ncbi:group 1 glycosyl transferase [Caballeronia fortuita]|uniref:Group 1 glycosyl transferase n=1 Tax=Caballeronia fortuita TaxID=1777138 RepID=A0A157Z199_9BURK|nr:glycosyltransferase [Caballeronia fortuita]SAK39308.1 group 1 glycosyl transferase [Caballeronia fortuita]
MKVLHIISSLERGGAEAVLFNVASRGPASRIEHRVVCLRGEGYYTPKLAAYGIHVEALNCPKGRLTLHTLTRLWSLIREFRPDVMQTWMYHADLVGGVLGYLAGIRSIYWAIHHANLDTDKNSRLTVLIAKICAKLSRRIPTRIVSCSWRGRIAHEQIGYDASKFTWIPNGYDTARFSIDPEAGAIKKMQWGISDNMPLIGCVARWHPQKDHRNLFRAVARMGDCGKRFRLVLVGQHMTADNAELVAALEAEGLQEGIMLVGPDENIPAVMNALDIHVLPSAGEAFPNVVAEAMACGALSVSTDVGDVTTIVGACGWVVPPQDPDALAQALGAALDVGRTTAGAIRREKGRERIEEQFGLGRMQDSYEALWRDALTHRPGATSGSSGAMQT